MMRLRKEDVQFGLLVSGVLLGLGLVLMAKWLTDEVSAAAPQLASDMRAQRGGSIYHLLRNHPDPKISQNLFGAWERGEVWVVSGDLAPMQGGVRLERLTAREAFARYGQRAAVSSQTVFIVDARILRASRATETIALELEEMLLLAYEYSQRTIELPDTAVEQ